MARQHGNIQYIPVTLPSQPPKRRVWPVRAGRWVARNRLWLIPLCVPVVLAIYGEMTHARGWWWWAIPVDLLVATAICVGAPDRWDRKQEVQFVRATAVGVAGWLIAATVWGARNHVMGWVLVGGWLAWTGGWWWHKRVRNADKQTSAWNESWQNITHRMRPRPLTGSEVIDVREDDDVGSLLIELDRGRQSIADLRAAVESILSAWEYPPETTARVEQHPRNRNWAWLHIQQVNPLGEQQEWDEELAPASFLSPFVVGFRPGGGTITTTLPKAHWFIVGQTQWGKSTWLSLMMAQLSACDDVLIWFIDLKGGGTARPWMPCIDWLATTKEEAEEMLSAAKRIILARSAITDDHVPSPEDPAIVIILDEANEAFGQGTGTSRLVSLGVSVASLGAGLSVELVVATQIGALYAVGDERLRGNLSKCLAFRCQQDSHAEYALADWATLSASKLSEPGMFYFKDQQAASVLGRGFWISRPQRSRIAHKNAAKRPVLCDALVQHAGEAYVSRFDRGSVSVKSPSLKPEEPTMPTPRELAEQIENDLPQPLTHAQMDAANEARAADGMAPLTAQEAAQTGEDRFIAALRSGPHSPKQLIEVSGMGRSWVMAYLAKLAEYGAVTQAGPRQPYEAVPGMDLGEAMEAIRGERRRLGAQAKELIDA